VGVGAIGGLVATELQTTDGLVAVAIAGQDGLLGGHINDGRGGLLHGGQVLAGRQLRDITAILCSSS